mgnify:CR=1 FL=1
MANEALEGISEEVIQETPMVDLTFELIKKRGEPAYFADIAKQIAELKGLDEAEMQDYMAQLYTEVNVDGRFICVGRGLWGLKDWYTVEQGSDAAVAANVKDDDDFEDDANYYEEDDDEDKEDGMGDDDEEDLLVDDDELYDGEESDVISDDEY